MGMKRSELKAIIKEALVEILPEVLMLMNEQMEVQPTTLGLSTQVSEQVSTPADLDLIRSKFRDSQGGDNGYGEIGGRPVAQRSTTPPPANPKAIIDGEKFASGKGIMEWFGKQGRVTPDGINTQERESKMNDFVAKKFGV